MIRRPGVHSEKSLTSQDAATRRERPTRSTFNFVPTTPKSDISWWP